MRVVHMDSGLGNQMLDYAEYLAIKQMNPDSECYLENMIYELPHVPGMFSQWNGYELERIFGIHVPNIKDIIDKECWDNVLKYLEQSQFWQEHWNFAPYITKALKYEAGITLRNCIAPYSDLSEKKDMFGRLRYYLSLFFKTRIGYHIKRILRKIMAKSIIRKENEAYNVFQKYEDNVFIGHSLAFRFKGFGLEKMEEQIREAFTFPQITDERNIEMMKKIRETQSVAIHARRSDLLSVNGYCYKYGFFKRAIGYIKKHVDSPVFFFFCDEKSIGWCEENEKVFGLDFNKDKVYFVDWNSGDDSFRDMQLMAECKHNVFTESSFGFWGAYLNRNPEKITCAPDPLIIATNSF